jgi:hypothetical protein
MWVVKGWRSVDALQDDALSTKARPCHAVDGSLQVLQQHPTQGAQQPCCAACLHTAISQSPVLQLKNKSTATTTMIVEKAGFACWATVTAGY